MRNHLVLSDLQIIIGKYQTIYMHDIYFGLPLTAFIVCTRVDIFNQRNLFKNCRRLGREDNIMMKKF